MMNLPRRSDLSPAEPARSLREVVVLRVALLASLLLGSFQINMARAQTPSTVPRFYWANMLGDLFSAALDGTSLQSIRHSRGAAGSLVVAPQATDLFAASRSAGGILRIDGKTGEETLAIETSANVTAMAYDEVNEQIYWAESPGNVLWHADLDGNNRRPLTISRSKIGAIQIDPINRRYYWSNLAGDIIRANFDTGNYEIFNYANELGQSNSWMIDLVLDAAGGRLYVADAALNAIVSIGVDGSEPRIVASETVANPNSLAIDPVNGRIYWSNGTRVIAGVAEYLPSLPPELQELIPEYTYIPSEYDHYVMSANFDGSDVRKEFQPRTILLGTELVTSSVGTPQHMAIVYITVPEPSSMAQCVACLAAMLIASHRFGRPVR